MSGNNTQTRSAHVVSLTHSLTHFPAYSFVHSLARSLTRSLTHALAQQVEILVDWPMLRAHQSRLPPLFFRATTFEFFVLGGSFFVLGGSFFVLFGFAWGLLLLLLLLLLFPFLVGTFGVAEVSPRLRSALLEARPRCVPQSFTIASLIDRS